MFSFLSVQDETDGEKETQMETGRTSLRCRKRKETKEKVTEKDRDREIRIQDETDGEKERQIVRTSRIFFLGQW